MYLFLFTLILSFLSPNVFAYPDKCRGFEAEFLPEINNFTNHQLAGKSIFAGSSSIRLWQDIHEYFSELYQNSKSDQNYFNRGFGGSQVCHLLIHYRKIFLGANTNQNPKRLIIYSGDNDLSAGFTPSEVVVNFKILIEYLRKDGLEAPVYLIAVKPSPSRIHLLAQYKTTALLMEQELNKLHGVYVINTFDEFFDNNGDFKMHYFQSDKLHLTSAAYIMWSKYLQTAWDQQE